MDKTIVYGFIYRDNGKSNGNYEGNAKIGTGLSGAHYFCIKLHELMISFIRILLWVIGEGLHVTGSIFDHEHSMLPLFGRKLCF